MSELERFITHIREKSQHQPQFLQAVDDILEHIVPVVSDKTELLNSKIVEQLLIPDRIIEFRITWQDDDGNTQINNGWRVQFNNAIGPYKGGLRFHPSVSLDTFKFLGFEQIFKNALTGLPMGGGKGGSDFDPKGKSSGEVKRFCDAFMMELYKYIGPDRDIPAGDIGVGAREIGYLFDTYKRITGNHHGVLTGKSPAFGGSWIRKEATGYGCVYFLEKLLAEQNQELENKRCAVSGSGNVALYTAEKLIHKGAKVITLSDSDGFIACEDGLNEDQLEKIRAFKEEQRGRLSELDDGNIKYHEGEKPWQGEYDIAIPAATQNEISEQDAESLIDAKLSVLCEAANMPLTKAATHVLTEAGIIVAPAKAANAGGVAVSGLERTQNAQNKPWDRKQVDKALKEIMGDIHALCLKHGTTTDSDKVDYIKGANVGGFMRVAEAMQAYSG